MRNSVSNIVVNSLDSSGFLNFDILVEDIRRQVLAPHLTIRCDHDLVDLKVKDEVVPSWKLWSGTFGVHIPQEESESHASNLDDDFLTWSLKDHVGTLCLRTISVRSKSECIQKSIKHLYFVHLFHYPAKKNMKTWKNTIFCKWYHVGTFAI